MSKGFERSNGWHASVVEMAKTYIWRLEMEEYQFRGVLTVLEGLGFLSEVDMSMIEDVIDEMYPKGGECRYENGEINGEAWAYCTRPGHGCENQVSKIKELLAKGKTASTEGDQKSFGLIG